jgi:hypothetical protein
MHTHLGIRHGVQTSVSIVRLTQINNAYFVTHMWVLQV